MLTSQQFDRTRRLALDLAGIELAERHRELLASRSRRLGLTTDQALDSLLGAAEEGDATATQQMLYLLTTKHTAFFRNSAHFEIAAEYAIRVARQRGRVRLWSAATATGEEAYSLAFQLIRTFQTEEPPASILATDVDADALAFAKRGEYAEWSLRGLEPSCRERFFRPAGAENRWVIIPAARRLVEFRTLNLITAEWPVSGPFDVIFCRNVLMYLEESRRCAVLERMASLLVTDGLLMLDPAEYPGKTSSLFTRVKDGVYSRRLSHPAPLNCRCPSLMS